MTDGVDGAGEPEAREALERLRECLSEAEDARDWYAFILDSSGVGILAVGLDGRVAFANSVAAIMWGSSRDELVGRLAHEMLPPCGRDEQPPPPKRAPVDLAVRDDSVHRVRDALLPREDGTSLAVDYVATPAPARGSPRSSGSTPASSPRGCTPASRSC